MPTFPPPPPASQLRRQLLGWYRRHRRELPWRARSGERVDAYRVWVSEIMLQQTRVAAVIPYYLRFLARFPTLAALAEAAEADVLAVWSGLGYYRRARQLHAAAGQVVRRHGGELPLEGEALRALPGIGEYTAGAILSIAAGQPWPAVDGNALRIARRLTGLPLSPAAARGRVAAWLAPRRPGEFNQALMDLGAMICLPRAPQCGECPLRRMCATRGDRPRVATARVGDRPRVATARVGEGARLAPSRPSQAVTIAYGLARRRGRVWLVQRPATAAQMPGLWELPEIGGAPGVPLATVRHAITTRSITAHIYATPAPRRGGSGRWLSSSAALALPLTGLARKTLRRTMGWSATGGSLETPLRGGRAL